MGGPPISVVTPDIRNELLRELTLAAMTDLQDDQARSTLTRWMEADPADINTRLAYLRRISAEPRSADPEREVRLAELSRLLESHPDHVGIRETLVTALADAGEADRSQATLEEWPAQEHDGRYWRLRGRFELEHDHLSQQAVSSLQKALRDFPQDWRTHYRLARALKNLGGWMKLDVRLRQSAGFESCLTHSSLCLGWKHPSPSLTSLPQEKAWLRCVPGLALIILPMPGVQSAPYRLSNNQRFYKVTTGASGASLPRVRLQKGANRRPIPW